MTDCPEISVGSGSGRTEESFRSGGKDKDSGCSNVG
jgi:hypothetical protein